MNTNKLHLDAARCRLSGPTLIPVLERPAAQRHFRGSIVRMWMVNPKMLCRKHLLGEHGEIHKHRHNFVKRHKMGKRISMGQIEPKSMKARHDALAAEMLARGFKHQSPYDQPDIGYLTPQEQAFMVDVKQAHADLCSRCEECAQLAG